jgi:hypothetical protein
MLKRQTADVIAIWVEFPAILENVKVIRLHGCPEYRVVIVWHTFASFEFVIRRDFPQCNSGFRMVT